MSLSEIHLTIKASRSLRGREAELWPNLRSKEKTLNALAKEFEKKVQEALPGYELSVKVLIHETKE